MHACCGAKPKSGQPFSRHSADPETVSVHLSSVGVPIRMKSEDIICSTCYKLHLSILKGIEEKTNSPDSVLRDSIEIWRLKVTNGDTVHLIFDNPGHCTFNPKEFEQRKRDDQKRKQSNPKSKPHEHAHFSPSTPVKRPWREYINCCQCKRSIVEALGLAYLQRARHAQSSPEPEPCSRWMLFSRDDCMGGLWR